MKTALTFIITLFPFFFNNIINGVKQQLNFKLHPGKIEASFLVDNSGQATYNIPIEVPPGRNGVQPNLSIVYSSQAQNDILGVGWVLNGISTITRGGKTKAIDNENTAISYSANDRFFLDGKELILNSSGTYGQNATSYITNINSNAKIVAAGNTGGANCPTTFKVYADDGKVLEYGLTTDSRLIPTGKTVIKTWALSKITDLNGNYITFTYTQINNTIRISNINYGLGINALATRFVKFYYSNRTDPIITYEGGTQFNLNYKLDSIATSINLNTNPITEKRVKIYRFIYSTANIAGQTRLLSITEFAADNSFKPSTTFSWDNNTNNIYPAILNNGNAEFTTGQGWTNQATYPRTTGDINGDGFEDMIGFAELNVSVCYGNKNGLYGGFTSSVFLKSQGWDSPSNKPIMVKDINADGKADLVGFGSDGVYYSLSTGNNFTPAVKASNDFCINIGFRSQTTYPRMLADINGDRLPDIVGFKDNAVFYAINTGNFSGSSMLFTITETGTNDFGIAQGYTNQSVTPRMVADINKDGMADIVAFGNAGVYYAFSNGSGFLATQLATADFCKNIGWSDDDKYPRSLGDINGDGYLDIIGFKDDYTYYAINQGMPGGNSANLYTYTVQGLTDFSIADGYTNQDVYLRSIVDLNADGRSDIIGFGSDGVYGALSNGNGFNAKVKLTANYGAANVYTSQNIYPRFILDYNGDGLPDINGCGTNVMQYCANLLKLPNKIDTILDGMGNYISIEYAQLTDSNVYRNTIATAYPVIPANNTYNVVKSYNLFYNGSGGYLDKGYCYKYKMQYTNLTQHVTYGWLGFYSKSESIGIKSVTSFYNKSYPTILNVDSTYIQNNVTLQIDRSYKSVTPGTVYGKFPYTVKETSKTTTLYYKQTNGNNQLLTTNGNVFRYDLNGNLITDAEFSYGYNTPIDTIYTLYNYLPQTTNSGNTILYLLQFEKKSKSAAPSFSFWNESKDIISKKYIYYDSVFGFKVKVASQWDNGDSSWLSNNYKYDTNGLIIQSCGLLGDTTNFTIDTFYKTYVVKTEVLNISKGKNKINTYTFDAAFGKQTSGTNTDGITTVYGYDGFGTQRSVYNPNPFNPSQLILTDTIMLLSTNYSPLIISTYKRNDWMVNNLNNWSYSIEYMDQLGRTKISESTGSNGNPIRKVKEYDSVTPGNINRESLPFYANQNPLSSFFSNIISAIFQKKSITTDSINWVNFSYYPNGKVKFQVVNSDTTLTQYNYLNGTTTVTKGYGTPLSGSITYYLDSKGQIIKRIDPNGGITVYAYNALGGIVSATDPEGITNTTTYNSLGHVTRVQNSDNGITTFTFQKGMPISVIRLNRNNLPIATERNAYDKMGRVICKTILNENGERIYTDSFFYDAQYSNGGIDSSVRFSFSSSSVNIIIESAYKFKYDIYSRLIVKKVYLASPTNYLNKLAYQFQIQGTAPGNQAYIFRYAYNAAGDLTKEYLPDGSVINHQYYVSGDIKKMEMLNANGSADTSVNVNYSTYTAMSQPTSIVYGNGLTAVYRFMPNKGVLQQQTLYHTTESDTLLNNRYVWNHMMNLDSIIDQRTTTDNPDNETKCYQYNNMGWLIGASAPNLFKPIAYGYKSGGSLVYRNNERQIINKGHQTSAVVNTTNNDTVFTAQYDNRGNMTVSTEQYKKINKRNFKILFGCLNKSQQLNYSNINLSLFGDADITSADYHNNDSGAVSNIDSFSINITVNKTLVIKANTIIPNTALICNSANIILKAYGDKTYQSTTINNSCNCDSTLTLTSGNYVLVLAINNKNNISLAMQLVSYLYTQSGIIKTTGKNTFTYLLNNKTQSITRNNFDSNGNVSLVQKYQLCYDQSGRSFLEINGIFNQGSDSCLAQSTANFNIDKDFIVYGIAEPTTTGNKFKFYLRKYLSNNDRVAMIQIPYDYVNLSTNIPAGFNGADTTNTAVFDVIHPPANSNNHIFYHKNWIYITKVMVLGAAIALLLTWLLYLLYLKIKKSYKGYYQTPKWASYLLPFITVNTSLYLIFGFLLFSGSPAYASQNKIKANNLSANNCIAYFHQNHVSSLNLVTDGDGNAIKRFHYDPYGRELNANNNQQFYNSGFTGKESVNGFGLSNYGPRMYNPFLGKFISADDQIGAENPNTPVALNRYAYAIANPIEYNDPSGHWAWLVSGIIGAVVSVITTVIVAAITGQELSAKDYLLAAMTGFIAGATGSGVGFILGKFSQAVSLGANLLGKVSKVAQAVKSISNVASKIPASLMEKAAKAGTFLAENVIQPFIENLAGTSLAGVVETNIRRATGEDDAEYGNILESAGTATLGGFLGKGVKALGSVTVKKFCTKTLARYNSLKTAIETHNISIDDMVNSGKINSFSAYFAKTYTINTLKFEGIEGITSVPFEIFAFKVEFGIDRLKGFLTN